MRLPEESLALIDDMVAKGRYDDRTDFLRKATEALLRAEERRDVDQAIVEGYERTPWTDLSEDDWDYEGWKAVQRAAG